MKSIYGLVGLIIAMALLFVSCIDDPILFGADCDHKTNSVGKCSKNQFCDETSTCVEVGEWCEGMFADTEFSNGYGYCLHGYVCVKKACIPAVEKECQTKDDCEVPYQCHDGMCVCGKDGKCGSTQTCCAEDGGSCVDLEKSNMLACGVCKEGFETCSDEPNERCRIDTQLDNKHCGGCNNPCKTDQRCVDGECKISCRTGEIACEEDDVEFCLSLTRDHVVDCNTCEEGYFNCADSWRNGCLHNADLHRILDCKTCMPGYRDCTDGEILCETPVTNDVENCGGCGVICENPTPLCVQGECVSG